MAAEEDVAIVVHGFDFNAGFAQDMATVAAACSPEGIEDNLDVGGGDGLEIDEFAEAMQEAGLHVGGLKAALRRIGVGNVAYRCWR